MEWTIVALVSPNFSFKSRTVSKRKYRTELQGMNIIQIPMFCVRLHPRGRDEVRVDAPAGEDHVQGDRRDDSHRGQERGRQDQLLGVQGDDGRHPAPHTQLGIILRML